MWGDKNLRNNSLPGFGPEPQMVGCDLCGERVRGQDLGVHRNGFSCSASQKVALLKAEDWVHLGHSEQDIHFFDETPHEVVRSLHVATAGLWVPEWVDRVWRLRCAETSRSFQEAMTQFGCLVRFMDRDESYRDTLLALIRLNSKWHEVLATAADLDVNHSVFQKEAS